VTGASAASHGGVGPGGGYGPLIDRLRHSACLFARARFSGV